MAGAVAARSPEEQIAESYSLLARNWGRQHWWPAHSRFEVIVGCFLTQNTSWTNVELALRNLRSAKLLNLIGIRRVPLSQLEQLIRSSGYFRQKARRLKKFVEFLDTRFAGSLTRMFAQPTNVLREELLSLDGIGPETADSILLYAGQHPVFVVDAYTRRIAARHRLIDERASYEDARLLFERSLAQTELQAELLVTLAGGASHRPTRMSMAKRSPVVQIYNEMHGLLIGVAKQYCLKSKARCEKCPLEPLLFTPVRLENGIQRP